MAEKSFAEQIGDWLTPKAVLAIVAESKGDGAGTIILERLMGGRLKAFPPHGQERCAIKAWPIILGEGNPA